MNKNMKGTHLNERNKIHATVIKRVKYKSDNIESDEVKIQTNYAANRKTMLIHSFYTDILHYYK